MQNSEKAAVVFVVTLLFVAGVWLSSKISGGAETYRRVSAAIQNHSFVKQFCGTEVPVVQSNDGPFEVALTFSGRRHGFYSVQLVRVRGKESVKVYWTELQSGEIQIDEIYSESWMSSDKLLWRRDGD